MENTIKESMAMVMATVMTNKILITPMSVRA